jgi:hypothetical protein
MRNLQNVNLSENNFGPENLEELILFLKDADNVIEHLNLYGNLIGDENTIKICEALNASRECKIVSLNLGKNNVHDESLPAICNLLECCSQIDILNLSHNWFHNKPASKLISTILNRCSDLKILDISWNCIGDDLVIIPSYEELANSEIRHPDKIFDNYALEEALASQKLKLRRNPFLPPLDEKGGKKILIASCTKYSNAQKNGILVVNIDFKSEEKVETKTEFLETEYFSINCICYLDDKKKDNNKKDIYLLAGGVDSEYSKGMVKLYKIYEEEGKTSIEFLQEVLSEENFEGAISCIHQLKNGKIIISAGNGNILFSSPNLDGYKEDDF